MATGQQPTLPTPLCGSPVNGSAVRRRGFATKSFVLMVAKKKLRVSEGMRFLFATEGRAFERCLSAFREFPAGRELLRHRPDLAALYASRAMLKAWPTGSLGQWYTQFMNDFALTEEPYLSIAREQAVPFAADPERAWFHLRFDSSHDIRHTLCGYRPDLLGEICLLSFRFAQIRHPGLLILILLGFINLTFSYRGPVVAPLWEAYRRGRRARLLDLLPWENGFAEPLAVQRAVLGLTPPRHYPQSFASEAYLGAAAKTDYTTHKGSETRERAFETT